MEMIFKEKDFCVVLKVYDWEQYIGKVLLVYCFIDVIIFVWVYMLVVVVVVFFVYDVFQGFVDDYYCSYFMCCFDSFDIEQYCD